MRRALWIGTSWKMNKTRADARVFADGLATSEPYLGIQRFVIPPFTALADVAARLGDTDVVVGAQNMHWAEAGAWTGEISAPMLTDCGATLVEIGHSERRTHFGETDETVSLKVEAAIRHGLTPLVCIGETADDKVRGAADEVLTAQVEAAVSRLTPQQKTQPILLAYEPVWAIGESGTPASPDYAEARQSTIVDVAKALCGTHIPCLYGGSVNADNCAELITRQHIDGLFIGRSAWELAGYLDILARCAAAISKRI